jgi:anthranilate synthase component 1
MKALPALDGTPLISLLRGVRDQHGVESIGFFQTGGVAVIGIAPVETYLSRNGSTTLLVPGQAPVEIASAPFALLQQILARRQIRAVEGLPFFQGGVIGYFGYDSVRDLEPTLRRSGNLAQASESYDAEFACYRFYLIQDRRNLKVTLLDAAPQVAEGISFEEFAASVSQIQPTPARENLDPDAELPLESMHAMLGKERFLTGVRKLKQHLRDGDIFQAVLSDKFSHAYDSDPLDLFEILSAINPAPYLFYFTLQGRSYLGASPEMLVRSEGGKLETHPIAGTRPRGATPEQEVRNERQLLASVKERAEHLMLVDLARNDLGRSSAPGSVVVPSFMKLRKFGGVMHLVSVVNGTLQVGLGSADALAACFPAGTLSGAPKVRAMQLLSELEPERRGFYGGAFIAASYTGDLESCITIRSISVQGGVATIQAGAGIVADSDAEREYAEISHKSRLSRRALALALATQAQPVTVAGLEVAL